MQVFSLTKTAAWTQKILRLQKRRRQSFCAAPIGHIHIQSVIDHTISRMGSTDLIGAASVFDPCHLLETEDNLSGYGTEKNCQID